MRLAIHLRPNTTAAAAPNSHTIGGAGTGVPLLPCELEPVELDELLELEELLDDEDEDELDDEVLVLTLPEDELDPEELLELEELLLPEDPPEVLVPG